MWKKELWLESNFVNNFYQGSIYNLVFLDLEFFPVYSNGNKVQQRIFGYTLTRLIKSTKTQYIKIQLIETPAEEKKLIRNLIADIIELQNKVFMGFNIINSDMYCLRKRVRTLKLQLPVSAIAIYDLYNPQQSLYSGGLNGLFEYLDIQINKQINGRYVRQNAKRVLGQKSNAPEILNTIYEYCLEDAKNYFYIVSNWTTKFTKINYESFSKFDFQPKRLSNLATEKTILH